MDKSKIEEIKKEMQRMGDEWNDAYTDCMHRGIGNISYHEGCRCMYSCARMRDIDNEYKAFCCPLTCPRLREKYSVHEIREALGCYK